MDTKIRTIVVIHASAEWGSFHRRGMLLAMADALPDSVDTLVVNRPITFDIGPWKHTRKFISGIWKSALTRESPRLHVFTPRLPLHEMIAARLPLAVRLNRRMMRRQIRSVVKSQFPDTTQLIQWIYYPSQRWVWDAFAEQGKVYECYDDYPRASGSGFDDKVWQDEKQVLEVADLSFATAQSILEARIPYARRLELLPNGVPDFFFERSIPDADDLIHKLPHPRIGYLGNIFSYLDFPLLEELCQRHPEWHLVLVGPVESERAVAGLRRFANAHFLGRRPYDQVPSILRALDVGLIPFVDNQFTRAINPLKLYEYLAVGLPTVATRLPELERFENVIRLEKNTAVDFEAAITRILATDHDAAGIELVEYARPYSWTNIVRDHVIPAMNEAFQF